MTDLERVQAILVDAAMSREAEEIVRLLRSLGVNAWVEESVVQIQGAIRAGFHASTDPVTKLASLGFAVAGMRWSFLFPGALPEVNRRWQAEAKAARAVI